MMNQGRYERLATRVVRETRWISSPGCGRPRHGGPGGDAGDGGRLKVCGKLRGDSY